MELIIYPMIWGRRRGKEDPKWERDVGSRGRLFSTELIYAVLKEFKKRMYVINVNRHDEGRG